jgi:glycosyltransferase involved in cell wall biosynthesis
MQKPFVSVIVATRNRAGLLAKTLDALLRQDWPATRLEIIVADNGSVDGTRDVACRAAARPFVCDVRYLVVSTPGKSHAVNAALGCARGDLMAFTDDDVQPETTWVRALAAAFEHESIDFVAGRVKPIWETAPPAWMSPALYGVLAVPDNGTATQIIDSDAGIIPIGANMAVQRKVIEQLGGLRVDLGKLDGSLRTGEDHEFFLRMLHAGFRGMYQPSAVVHHWVPAERLRPDYFRRWLYQNGRDVARLQTAFPFAGRRVFRVPGYLWRRAANDARTTVTAVVSRDWPERFAAEGRLRWMAGYLLESWRRRSSISTAG